MSNFTLKEKGSGQNCVYNTPIWNERISNLIVFHIALMFCKNVIVSNSQTLLSINGKLNLAVIVIYAVLYLREFIRSDVILHINLRAYIVVFLTAIYIVITAILDPKLFSYHEFPYNYVSIQLRMYIAYALPLFLFISALHDTDYLLTTLFRCTPILFSAATVGLLVFFVDRGEMVYNMSYGYNVLFLIVLYIFKYKETGKTKVLIAMFLSIGYVLAAGSRGPLMCIAVALGYAVLTAKPSRSKAFWIQLGVVAAALILPRARFLLLWLYATLKSFGINSRTIYMLAQGNISYDSGRNEYHTVLMQKLNEHPFTGLGAFAGERTVGLSHGFYLDVIANFGYILGIILLIVLFYNVIKICIQKKGTSQAVLLSIFSIIQFSKGIFDGTIFGDKEIWIILALILVKFENKKSFCRNK